MDLSREYPQNEARMAVQNPTVSAFGVTLQGASHKRSTPPAPCQDAHAMCWMEDEGIFLAAIADGVGSCKLSHWGAYTAVNAALESVQEAIGDLAGGKRLRLDAESGEFRKQMKGIMVSAFRAAQDAVERLADEAEPPQLVFALQSTLTLAIYDGQCLYHGHAGDDGIVAQLPDGTVEMATRRMKGEEASSVYPLQSGEKAWSFGLVPKVAGFVMATDGVLDAFVQSHPDYYGINYCNGICYAFMEDAMKQLADKSAGAAEAVMQQYLRFMQSEEYTQRVTDDLTLVAAVSPALMAKSRQPDFSLEIWNTIAQESINAKRRALNHRAAQKASQPVHKPALPAEALAALPQKDPAAPGGGRPNFFGGPKDDGAKKMIIRQGITVVVLALVMAALLGMLLVNRFQLRRQKASYNDLSQQYSALSGAYEEQKASYSELTQQYSALSEAHDEQKASYNELTQQYSALSGAYEEQKASYSELTQQYGALSEAHDALKERCDALEQEARDAQDRAESAESELEAIRQSVIIMETTPEPTPEPMLEPTEQPGTSVVVQESPETNEPAESLKKEKYS